MLTKFLQNLKKIFLSPFFEIIDLFYPEWSERRFRADLHIWGEILREMIEDCQTARKKVYKIRELDLRASALTFIAAITYEHSDFDLARQTARKIHDPFDKAAAFIFIANITHESRDFDSARKVIDEIKDPHWKAAALNFFSSILAKTEKVVHTA